MTAEGVISELQDGGCHLGHPCEERPREGDEVGIPVEPGRRLGNGHGDCRGGGGEAEQTAAKGCLMVKLWRPAGGPRFRAAAEPDRPHRRESPPGCAGEEEEDKHSRSAGRATRKRVRSHAREPGARHLRALVITAAGRGLGGVAAWCSCDWERSGHSAAGHDQPQLMGMDPPPRRRCHRASLAATLPGRGRCQAWRHHGGGRGLLVGTRHTLSADLSGTTWFNRSSVQLGLVAMHGAPLYIAETSPPQIRGTLISLKELFMR
ncbi:hypothetical protein SETIT_5G100300v2 [Setaria italica]|uniref:Uncharacterized protein n=1 Tax=Setaria italica TaxID=4555 RepID=A0A368R347_SETIT|nr:hypothetical protein SETIT_5G100300v2 [Setaria italica]